jgi:hypothetical protein
MKVSSIKKEIILQDYSECEFFDRPQIAPLIEKHLTVLFKNAPIVLLVGAFFL